MITFREVEERIKHGNTPETIREFLEEAARSGKMFDEELVRFICNYFDNDDYVEKFITSTKIFVKVRAGRLFAQKLSVSTQTNTTLFGLKSV